MEMLRIRNWAKFQHYKDRNPPWIKLHVEILSSEDWVTLDDASKLLAIACMVIGAKHDGHVPDNPDYIKRVAYLQKRPNLTPLIECGFLEISQADASDSKQVLATARPEKETQVRKQKAETEKKEEVRATRAAPTKGTRWPPDKVVPEDWLADADIQRHEHDLTRIDLRLEATRFANYWAAKSGGTASKLDWHRTWINWALSAEKGNGTGRRTSAKPAGPNWGAIGEFAREDSQDPRGDSARAAQPSRAGPALGAITSSPDREPNHESGAGPPNGAAGSGVRLAAIERGGDEGEIPAFLLRSRPSA